jgi:hypothetical protein
MIPPVRTTLDIDDDVLQAAKELANLRGSTAGKMLSELARRGLQSGRRLDDGIRNGVPILPRRSPGAVGITMSRVNTARDDS